MIRTGAAYQRLASILGSKITNRSKTLRVEGEPTKCYTQTLLLIPQNTASSLALPPDAEPYMDKKTKEEFVALVLSSTTPRNKIRVPVPPPNPMMEIRMIVGQGVYHQEHGWGVIQGPKILSEEEQQILTTAQVRIVRSALHSKFHYTQIISQLDLLNENKRLIEVCKALKDLGTPTVHTSALQAVPATEDDSTRLLGYMDGKSFVQLTPKDESGKFRAFVPNPQDDSSIHSTIPLNRSTPAKPAGKILNLNQDLQSELEKEFDEKFRHTSE
jgi:hypothetical protein